MIMMPEAAGREPHRPSVLIGMCVVRTLLAFFAGYLCHIWMGGWHTRRAYSVKNCWYSWLLYSHRHAVQNAMISCDYLRAGLG